jgi:hypothetical protein
MGTRNRLAGDLRVAEIATRNVFTCIAYEEIHEVARLKPHCIPALRPVIRSRRGSDERHLSQV